MANTRRVTIAPDRDAVRERHSETSPFATIPSSPEHSNPIPLGGRMYEGQPTRRAGSTPPLFRHRFISVSHVAKRLSVSERTVRYWAELGELPAFKIGPCNKLWRFDSQAIEEYLKSREAASLHSGNLDRAADEKSSAAPATAATPEYSLPSTESYSLARRESHDRAPTSSRARGVQGRNGSERGQAKESRIGFELRPKTRRGRSI